MGDTKNENRAALSQAAHYAEILEYLETNNIFVLEMMQYFNTVKRVKRPGDLFRRCDG
jgi:hypothetical protein